MSEVRFSFTLSDKCRDEIFVETGEYPKQPSRLDIESTSLSRDARAALVNLRKTLGGEYGLGEFGKMPTLSDIEVRLTEIAREQEKESQSKIDTISAKIEELERADSALLREKLPFDTRDEAFLKKHLPEHYDRYKALLEKRILAQKEYEIEQERLNRELVAAEGAKKLAVQQEKADWINQFGSAHLKRAFTAGYNCQRKYVQERAAIEYPGFEVDFDDKAEWCERACPSQQALDVSEKYPNSQIVWLTKRHDASDDGCLDECYYAGAEVVAIYDFLGKYDLICYL